MINFFKKKIKIKYFTDEIYEVVKIGKGDLIDLRAAKDIELKAGEYKLIPLGVAMKLPKGYKANLYPRSSTYKNFGIILANSVGQIDSSYCGDNDQWMFPAIALRDTVIHRNDRICQFEIQKIQPGIKFEKVKSLSKTNRGGIGSTGVK
jgi:dUTP pyrophosphatase